MENLILYDGKCNLCNYTLQFILKRDKLKMFHYLPLQSSQAKEILKTVQFDQPGIDSVIFIENGRAYIKSEAFFRIASQLGGWFKLMNIFKLVPKKIADLVYDMIARNRQKWFGKNENCSIERFQSGT